MPSLESSHPNRHQLYVIDDYEKIKVGGRHRIRIMQDRRDRERKTYTINRAGGTPTLYFVPQVKEVQK